MFELRYNGDVAYYAIPSFEETGLVKHCFTTVHGGVSQGCYATMNLRSHSGDRWENVLENFGAVADTIGFDRDRLVLSKQVHEDVVMTVGEAQAGNGILYENRFKSADALITNERNLPIAVFSADCVPLFFLDPVKRVIALAHSGWRGTVKRIAQKTAEKMETDYGSRPEDILIAIGPSIQEECFEVGDEVAEEFIRNFGTGVVKKYGDKYHVSMQRAIKQQLNEIGATHIDDCGLCTKCGADMFYSHRRMGDKRGNMGAFLMLK